LPCHKCRAIVLSKTDYGETSQIVAVFTPSLGMVRALAKGARRPRGDFEGGFDLWDLVDLVFLTRAQGLATLTESRLVIRPKRIRRSQPLFLVASAIRELVLRGSAERDPNAAVFDALAKLLDLFETVPENKGPLLLVSFEMFFLAAHGMAPQWTRCIECAGALERKGGMNYDAREGGLVCRSCLRESPSTVKISGGAAALAAGLAERPFDNVAVLGANRRLVRELQEVVKLTLAYSSLVVPRSLRYV